jgi:hypothetical protein
LITGMLFCTGCGGDSSSSQNISQAQAQAVSAEMAQALAQALGDAFATGLPAAGGAHPSLAAAVKNIHPDSSSSPCTSTATGENCNWPVSFDGPCPGGGTIAVTGNVDGSLDNTGVGSIQTLLTITPASCSVDSLVINGDPSVTVDGQINFTDSAPVFPITLTEVGGVSYGPNPSGSCQFNVTYAITSETSCTITGTACGQSVNGSC